jgi:hypothetical protein
MTALDMSDRHVVTKDNGVMSPVLADHNEAFQWLLDHQSQSTDWAMKHEGWDIKKLPVPDDRDLELLQARQHWVLTREGPAVGDHVLFSDGVRRRISHHWRDNEGWDGGLQTSDTGSWYLGADYISFSGGLHPCVPYDEFRQMHLAKLRAGRVWFFHHNHQQAHNGVEALVNFRQWFVNRDAN